MITSQRMRLPFDFFFFVWWLCNYGTASQTDKHVRRQNVKLWANRDMRPCRISSVAVSWTTSLCIIYKVKRRNTSSAFRFGTADKYTQCYAANNTHKGTIFTRNRKKTALSMSTRISNVNVRIKISWRPDNVTLLAPPLLFVYFVPGVAATIIFYTILVTGR